MKKTLRRVSLGDLMWKNSSRRKVDSQIIGGFTIEIIIQEIIIHDPHGPICHPKPRQSCPRFLSHQKISCQKFCSQEIKISDKKQNPLIPIPLVIYFVRKVSFFFIKFLICTFHLTAITFSMWPYFLPGCCTFHLVTVPSSTQLLYLPLSCHILHLAIVLSTQLSYLSPSCRIFYSAVCLSGSTFYLATIPSI